MKKKVFVGGAVAVLFNAALLAVFLFYSSPAPAVVIQPGPDDGIDAFVTNVYGTPEFYEAYKEYIPVGGWGDYYYGLIRFPLGACWT